MKEVKKEVVTTTVKTVFVANDGTEFNDKFECEKYEKSAKGVLLAKYSPLVIKSTNEETMFGTGCCDNDVEIVRIETQEDADLILQILFLENSWYTDSSHEERREEAIAQLNSAIGDYLVVGRGYDHDGFWLYGSRKSIIDDFNAKFANL